MSGLNFKGKSFVQNYHRLVEYHELIHVEGESCSDSPSLQDNLIVHGDNLVALKALLPTYSQKVRCVYIDPPYNTGNENWVYNDNVNSPMIRDWLGKVVDKEDLTRHEKWLCMMMPRLRLLRELLRDDGAIFVSIDDNEVHHLRMLMDEVFGDDNFVTCIVWQKKVSPSNDAKWFSSDHDYVLVYANHKDMWRPRRLPMNTRQLKNYRNPDNDPRGPYNSATYTCNKSKDERPNLYYPIVNPNTGKEVWPKTTAVWAYSQELSQQHAADGLLYWGKNGRAKAPRLKKFLEEAEDVVPRTVWSYGEVGHTQEAMQEFLGFFPEGGFSSPKPTRLIEKIIQISTDSSSEDIILDSFAGSGTTAQAVLTLNKKDKGNRKFILVECEDYARKITAHRVRKSIEGLPSSKDELLKAGLGGTFTFFEVGQPISASSLLRGEGLPSFEDLARYVFYTATGEQFRPELVDRSSHFIGETAQYKVYLFYEPDVSYLKNTALTLEMARGLSSGNGKRRLVFAPAKYLDNEYLAEFAIDFLQLPYEIYKIKG